MTQLVGREVELEGVVERLRDRRLVTLTGPGGIGKTALASEAAGIVAPEFAYGSIVVDLTRVDQPVGVAEAIAGQVGYADFDSLLDSPGDQPTLIVVDNCEHVLDAAAAAIAAMLAACRMPTFLATSRAPLDLPDETIYSLGPLAVPADGSVEADGPAMRMLWTRVSDHGVDPDTLDVDDLIELCRRLDGVPLALELAAARLRVVTLPELLSELDVRPHALARRRFRGKPDHRGVADMVGWSTALLEPVSRLVFDRLGVFAGPFTAPMAVGVVGAEVPADTVRTALEDLVDASLVVADASGDTTRYRLLHPIRSVAVEQLRSSGQLETVESRFVDLVVESAVEVIVRTSETWDAGALPALVEMYDNIAASIRWLIDHDEEPDRALVLLAVSWGLVHQTHTAEIARLGESVLARWDDRTAAMWPDAIATVATCRTLTGRYEESVELATATLDDAEQSAYAPSTLRRVLAQTHRILGDPDRAIATFREGAEAARRNGVFGFSLELMADVGAVLAEVGQPMEGLEVIDATLAEAVDRGDRVNEAWSSACRAHVLLDIDAGGAEHEALAALELSRSIDYPAGRSCSLRTLSRARLARDDVAGASRACIELLDELLTRGGMNDLRLVTDLAAGILHRAGDQRWVDLAATTAALPITTVMVPVVPDVGVPESGTVMSLRDAYVLTRDALGDLLEASNPVDALPDQPEVAPAAAPIAGGDPTAASMTDEGDVVRIAFGGRIIRVRRSKGMVDLARLLASPDVEIASVDLMGAQLVATAAESEHIDQRARQQYEDRVRELMTEIEQAEDSHDIGTVDRLRLEMDLLVDELTRSTGLGGRSRMSAAPAEKARSAVTQRIRGAIKRIAEHDAVLGDHLDMRISTGVYCRYTSDDISWTIEVA